MNMETFQIVLILATLLCSLVAGFVFAFACVAMPGIGGLNDREFIQAFQVIDRVIQNNQPLFLLVWVGSVVAIAVSALLGVRQLEGVDRMLLIIAGIVYLVGVQLPTITVNVPLNSQLQTVDVQTMDETALTEARKNFEPRWNRWNIIRTVIATMTSALLIFLLLRL